MALYSRRAASIIDTHVRGLGLGRRIGLASSSMPDGPARSVDVGLDGGDDGLKRFTHGAAPSWTNPVGVLDASVRSIGTGPDPGGSGLLST